MKTNKLLIVFLLFSLFHMQAEGKEVYNNGNPNFPRKALVAPDCLINDLINVVKVASGTEGLNNLLDENIDNYATLGGLAGVGVLADPIIRVKDRMNYYPAATVAGFCIQAEAGSSLLSLNLLKNLSIMLYKDGVLQETLVVDQGQGSVLNLDLIQVSTTNQVNSFLTVTSTKEFDEIGLAALGVNVDALSALKVKYAFAGDAQDLPLITKNVPGITASGAIPSKNLIDENLTNYATVASVLLDLGATITLEWGDNFPKGSKVGFKFDDSNLLNIGLANAVSIKLTDKNGNHTTTPINAKVLELGLIGESERDISIQATQAFNKAELIITGLGISVKARSFYYGYIQNPPVVAHSHDLGLNANATICDNETEYQLNAKESVTWSLISKPAGDNTVTVNASTGKVTGMTPGVTGDYVFRATASDGCTEDITIHKGVEYTINPGCNEAITPHESLGLSTDTHGLTGSLISISDLKNKENIIDNSLYTYAEYTGGLTLIDNLEITGIKRTDGQVWNSSAAGSRVGFVVEANSTFLNANVLQFFRVRLYNSKTGQWVVRDGVIDKTNIVSAGLIGSEQASKVRYSISVPANTEFDEVTLWKSGVLSADLSTLRIYGAFMEDANANCYNDPLGCSSELITADKGARINYDATGTAGLVSAISTIHNLESFIDNDITTATTMAAVANAVSTTPIAVKLGKTYGKSHQIGIIIDQTTYLAGVSLADWLTVETYYQGSATADKKTDWSVLGVDAIGYGDKTYLILRPTTEYDEIRITATGVAGLLDNMKLYGIFVRNDADGDGIPDCSDEDSCPGDGTNLTDVKLDASDICEGNALTLIGKGTAGKTYTVACTGTNLGTSLTFTIAADGTFTWTSEAVSPAGRLYTLMIVDENGRILWNLPFTVHPLQTTWKTSPADTDWNNWDNWTNGSPLTCTNVIIPSGCSDYPVLTGADATANGCNNIHFESNAEVVKTHLLTYAKVSVDLTLEPDRYYMLSAPLKSMVTGDMFIPATGNPTVFTPLDATAAPQNRFNPRIYQRLWASNAEGQPLTGSKITVTPDETRWTPPFNALAQSFEMGKGFSLKAVKGTASTLTFRFPKEHISYEYVTENNGSTGITETISRTGVGHFIYEGSTFPITVALTNDAAGTAFLCGNPFMSHIDIATFLAENTAIKSVKVYDGNSSNSLILADGELLTNGTSYTKIAPMQSFFVTVDAASTTQSIQYTEAMLVSGAGNILRSKAAVSTIDPATLRLTATAGEYASKAILRINPATSRRYVSGEDAEVLIDNEVRPVIALFSVADGKALDIQQLDEATEIPLGFHLKSPVAVSLSVDRAGTGDWAGWSLQDVETGKKYSLDNTTTIDLGVLSTNIGRFYLKNETATGTDEIEMSDDKIYCTRLGTERVAIVRSTTGDMTRCEVFSAAGIRIDEANKVASEYRLRLAPGVNIIKVYLPDGSAQVFKLACF